MKKRSLGSGKHASSPNAGNGQPQLPFLEALAGKAQSKPPVWLMRQAGRYLPEYREVRVKAGSFLDLCYTPALAAEVTLQPIRRYGFDAAIVFSDILVVPHALGQHVEFLEGEGPKLKPIANAKDLAKLSGKGAGKRFDLVYEAIERIVPSLGGQTPLIGFCGAPWTVASYMVEGGGSPDQRAAKLLAYRDPKAFKALLDLLVETSSAYLIGQVKAGVGALQIFDSWAGSLADNDFVSFAIEPAAEIVQAREIRVPRCSNHRLSKGKLGQFRALCHRHGRRCTRLRHGGPAGSQWPGCSRGCPSRATSIRCCCFQAGMLCSEG